MEECFGLQTRTGMAFAIVKLDKIILATSTPLVRTWSVTHETLIVTPFRFVIEVEVM